jgi:hypothetical protein
MSVITINQEDIVDYYGDLVPAYARLFAHKDFRTSEGIFVAKGSPDDNSGFYQQFTASLVGTKIRIATGTAYSTTDALVNTTTAYSLVVYDANGTEIKRVFSNIHIPPVTPTTWGAIEIFSKGKQQRYPSTYLDSNQIIALLSQYQSNIIAPDDVYGPAWNGSLAVGSRNAIYDAVEALRAAKQDTLVAATNIKTINGISPLGPGDLVVTGGVETFVNSPTTLSNLITAAIANPSIRYDAIVDSAVAVTSANAIPSNVFFESKNGGMFFHSFTGALNFAGIGLANPESQNPIFSGFGIGDITWTGATSDLRPASISTELWDTGDNSLSQRLLRANAAFGTNFVKFICYPRLLTDSVALSASKEIYFTPGDYLNTTNTGDAAFYLSSDTTFHGTQAARLHEGTNPGAIRIIGPSAGDLFGVHDRIVIEDLSFIGNTFAIGDGVGSTILLGNCHNSIIRNCLFYETHGYAAYVGGFSDTGNYAYDCEIVGNDFIRIGQQVTGSINGKNIRIANNYFDQRQSVGNGTYTVIDLEPNAPGDVQEGIIVEDNYIDARDYNPDPKTFIPSAVNTTADTIALPSHGIGDQRTVTFSTTGALPSPLLPATTYYARVIDANTIQVSATNGGASINLTSQGTGTHTITTNAKFVIGIMVQAVCLSGNKDIVIRDNTIVGTDIIPAPPTGVNMTLGIGAAGVNVLVAGNKITGGQQGGINVAGGRYVQVLDNEVIQSASTGTINNELTIYGIADGYIANNHLQKTLNPSGAGIYEIEIPWAVTGSGSTLTHSGAYPGFQNILFHPYYAHLTIIYNGNEYTISSITDVSNLVTSSPVGTVTTKTWVPANVNTATDTINIPAHGYNTGARILPTTTGAFPAHTLPPADDEHNGNRWYWIIRVDADNIKLASSLANAMGGTAIDLTDTGSGTATIVPIMFSKFSSNRYAHNFAEDGISIQPLGTSQIVTSAHDNYITSVADTNYTALSTSGNIVYISLTAPRTVNLPDATHLRGKTIVIKDGAGTAGTNNITLDGNGSQTIDGALTKALNVNYGTIRIQSDGANWITLNENALSSLVNSSANTLTGDNTTPKLILNSGSGAALWYGGVGTSGILASTHEVRTYADTAITWWGNIGGGQYAFYPNDDNSRDLGGPSNRWQNIYAVNGVLGGRAVSVKTQANTPVTVSASADGNKLYTNEGTTARVDFNLPTAVAGLTFTFYCADTDGIRVIANTGDDIRIAGSVSATAGRIDSTVIGSCVKLTAINATNWIAEYSTGTWTVT